MPRMACLVDQTLVNDSDRKTMPEMERSQCDKEFQTCTGVQTKIWRLNQLLAKAKTQGGTNGKYST